MVLINRGVFLKTIYLQEGSTETYPYNIPAFRGLAKIELTTAVTFLVGENGSGKSTLLEAIASAAGFNPEGGSRDHRFATVESPTGLENAIRLSWFPKATSGFFLRAESFFNFSSYLDEMAKDFPDKAYQAYGGKSLHRQSHGEAFFALFTHRFRNRGKALYLLDEPEAALSPARQLAFLRLMWDHEQRGQSQFLIATHSPILLGYPHATILTCDTQPLSVIAYEDTEHYRITKQFLLNREGVLKELFKPDPD